MGSREIFDSHRHLYFSIECMARVESPFIIDTIAHTRRRRSARRVYFTERYSEMLDVETGIRTRVVERLMPFPHERIDDDRSTSQFSVEAIALKGKSCMFRC